VRTVYPCQRRAVDLQMRNVISDAG
jgi:hypothetical protein